MNLHWKWIFIGAIIGLIIIGTSFYFLEKAYSIQNIKLIGYISGFLLTGILTGYYSPGRTVIESAIAGGVLIALFLVLIAIVHLEFLFINYMYLLGIMTAGVVITGVGGWTGEKLQGTIDKTMDGKDGDSTFQWGWFITGVLVGFCLNVLLIVILAPLYGLNLMLALGLFCLGTMLAGFIIGFKSPGIAIKEASLAGAATILLETILLVEILEFRFDPGVFATAMFLGFILTLTGAWIGEETQARIYQIY